jgi:2-iminobutanoate/2-iminopropanoate deaminase
MKKALSSPQSPAAIGHYSPALQVGDFLFLSGQLGMDPEGNLAEGVEAQTRRALENLRHLLKAAGLGLEDVVKTTIFLKNMEDFPRVNEVYASFFSSPYPARSTVEVARLPKDALVEIEAIALRRPS